VPLSGAAVVSRVLCCAYREEFYTLDIVGRHPWGVRRGVRACGQQQR
jgi:hypothetical protein